MQFVPRARILTLEELAQVARAFAELNVNKIRLTGGEPLVRKNVLQLFQSIGQLPQVDELVLTTNGSQLTHMAQDLKNAGVKRINISLDSLKADRFTALTRVGKLDKVLDGIEAARAVGFEKIKLNSVILKNRNHDEVVDLVNFAIEKQLDISFIEEMPLGETTDHDRAEAYYSSDEIEADLNNHFDLLASTENTGGPSRYMRIPNTQTRVGFISPHSHNFCSSCNRVRVTAEGRLLLCLGQEHSVDLRKVLRAHPGDIDRLKETIIQAMKIKPEGHDFKVTAKPIIFRHMSHTGG